MLSIISHQTEGEGNGKKISKKKSAETMLRELRQLPPLTPLPSATAIDNVASDATASPDNANINNIDDATNAATDTPNQAVSSSSSSAAAVAIVRTTAKRKQAAGKKKARNLIKSDGTDAEEINPISRLIQVAQAQRAKEPLYELIEETGPPRRREFVIRVTACAATATGAGSTKKTARRLAAESELIAIAGFVLESGS